MEDLLQVAALVLLVLFVLSLITGRGLRELGIFVSFLAVLAGAAYLFYAGFSPAVAAAVVAAGAALVILLRQRPPEEKPEKKPLFDIRLVEERCVPLEESIDRFPELKGALKGIVPFNSLNQICFRTYEGEDVPGGRARAMFLKLLFTPVEIAVRVMSALEERGIKFNAWNRGLTWEFQIIHSSSYSSTPIEIAVSEN